MPPHTVNHAVNHAVNKQSTFTNQKAPKYTGPIITVFVGNINERVSDIIIRQILDVSILHTRVLSADSPSLLIHHFFFC